MNMKIAVTGASGHIGNNLCRALVESGYEVIALIHLDGSSLGNLRLFRVHADVLDPASLRAAFQDVDVVYHLAAKISIEGDPGGAVMRVNVEGTRNVVEACLASGVKRLIHFSASHVFQQDPHDEELDERRSFVQEGAFPYERSKFLAELEVLKGVKAGLNAVILNPTSVLGPYDYKPSLLGKALIDLYNGGIPSVVPGGFDWIDVRDVVTTSIAALEKGKSGERYLISGTWKTTRELAAIMEEVTGKRAPKYISPLWLAKLAVPFSKAMGKLSHTPPLFTKEALSVLSRSNPNVQSRKARKELIHTTRPLCETIRDTYGWYQLRGMIY
jgi:dihydroflavonol-4-reductase